MDKEKIAINIKELRIPKLASKILHDIVINFYEEGYFKTNSEISEEMDISKSTVSRYIKKLELLGLVFRKDRKNDMYGIIDYRVLFPTHKGLEVFEITHSYPEYMEIINSADECRIFNFEKELAEMLKEFREENDLL